MCRVGRDRGWDGDGEELGLGVAGDRMGRVRG